MIHRCKSFDELNTIELYKIIQLRLEVFIMEQTCYYMDCDDKDLQAHHVMYWDNDTLVAYCRLLPEGVSYAGYCSIGRVATKQTHRGKELGKKLMIDAIRYCEELYNCPIKISAQSYLEKFYRDFGFIPTGEAYLEDDIPHMGMILKP
jgi:ElaA protein